MSTINPTKRQQEVLNFIKNFKRTHGISPSFREMARGLGISLGAIQDHLRLLQRKRFITWTPGKKRAIRLLDKDNLQPTIPIPLLGTISAGEGIALYEEENPEIIEVPKNMVTFGFNHYCLKVAGNSMILEGIWDNDTVLVRKQRDASPGDVVVAVLKGDFEEKATIKKYWPQKNEIKLKPRNPKSSTIRINSEQLDIRGKFVGLIRKGGG